MAASGLASILDGDSVFLDSNVLVYAALKRSKDSDRLVTRCATRDVIGHVTVSVIEEVVHKLMLAEARERGLISSERATLLVDRPEIIRQLGRYNDESAAILALPLRLLQATGQDFEKAAELRKVFGLMTRDSMILAAMARHQLSILASSDRAFERVPGLMVHRPEDV